MSRLGGNDLSLEILMVKLLKLVLLVMVLVCGAFVLWMNLTPGHFQREPCVGDISYINDRQLRLCSEYLAFHHSYPPTNWLEKFELVASNLDFYK